MSFVPVDSERFNAAVSASHCISFPTYDIKGRVRLETFFLSSHDGLIVGEKYVFSDHTVYLLNPRLLVDLNSEKEGLK